MAKTIVGELADLYVKYGGKRSDLKGTETTAEMIDAIEQIIETSGGSGETPIFVVNCTMGENSEITTEKTAAEIVTAATDNGKVIVLKVDNVDGNNKTTSFVYPYFVSVDNEGYHSEIYINTGEQTVTFIATATNGTDPFVYEPSQD